MISDCKMVERFVVDVDEVYYLVVVVGVVLIVKELICMIECNVDLMLFIFGVFNECY